jgi:hypothetical protein
MNVLTASLRSADYGVACLEKFNRTLHLTVLEMKAAEAYIEEILSKVANTVSSRKIQSLALTTWHLYRRYHWPKSLKDSEEIIWTRYKVSFARLRDCKEQVGSVLQEATSIKNDVRRNLMILVKGHLLTESPSADICEQQN